MKQVLVEFTDAERVLFRAEFEFWYTVAGMDCREANQKAYDKVMRKRALAELESRTGINR